MKFIKGFGLLSFLTILSGSCFDPPEFPVVPQIEFDRLEFIDSVDPSDFDSLNLYIRFKDGDGDLGFTDHTEYISDPFHNAFFYQEDNGNLFPISTISGFIGTDEYDLLQIPDANKGKLVLFRTREKPGYNFLPQTFDCAHYEYLGGPPNPASGGSDGRRLLIRTTDIAALDPMVKIVDTLHTTPAYYQIRDTLYFTPNSNHYNIEVDFFIKDSNAEGGFREFDWREEFCTTFDGRFPVFSDKPSSIDGTLRYSMTSLGFKSLFSIQTLKLRVTIRDRALHSSNVIETPEFRL